MSLRSRILLLLSLLLAGSVMLTTALLTLNVRQQMLNQQTQAGQALARVLARTAATVDSFPAEMEDAIGQQMVVEATLAAHFIAAAQAAGWTREQINARLQQITSSTALNEFWITDANSHAIFRNRTEINFTFSSNAQKKTQSAIFYGLLTGQRQQIIQDAARRDFDGKIFKYVGVAGVDSPRIVQVGYEIQLLQELHERVSLDV